MEYKGYNKSSFRIIFKEIKLKQLKISKLGVFKMFVTG